MPIPPVTDLPGFPEVHKLLMDASFHFADDTAREWGSARKAQREACQIIIDNRWPAWRIAQAHEEIKPIMPLEDLYNTILQILYSREDTQ
jgi:hypothetical protein